MKGETFFISHFTLRFYIRIACNWLTHKILKSSQEEYPRAKKKYFTVKRQCIKIKYKKYKEESARTHIDTHFFTYTHKVYKRERQQINSCACQPDFARLSLSKRVCVSK